MQEVLTFALGVFTIATTAGTVSGFFYGFRQKTTIEVLERSNKAYESRNSQLESEINSLRTDYDQRISSLEGQVETLKRIKTPPLQPLIEMVSANHAEIMKALEERNE